MFATCAHSVSTIYYELWHISYPSGDHELKLTRELDGDVERKTLSLSSGRRKFHEMAHLEHERYHFVGNACHLQLPELFVMESVDES